MLLLNKTDCAEQNIEKETTEIKQVSFSSFETRTQTLLSTVKLQFKTNKGNVCIARALLDSGSQTCFMTNEFVRQLALPITSLNYSIIGVGKNEFKINYQLYAEAQTTN